MNLESRCCNVAVVHDDPLIAAGLRAILNRRADLRVVDPDEPTCGVDVAVADYAAALALLDAAAGRAPPAATRVLVISTRSSEHEVRHALRRGVHGYLVQGGELDELDCAIAAIARGDRYVGRLAAQRLADGYALEDLTGREHDVLRELVAGQGNKRIATRLDISIGTVKAHIRAIFQKLGVNNRTQAAAVAEQRGLLAIVPARGAAPAAQRAGASNASTFSPAAAPLLRALSSRNAINN